MGSYYEQLCRQKGIKIPFYVRWVRNADKMDAAERRKLLRKARQIR